MCSITAIFKHPDQQVARARALEMSRRLRHRGPDASGIHTDQHATLVHERLSIVDPASGAQPLHDKQTGRVLIANGEIYTHKDLRKKFKKEHDFQTASDCEILLYLYDEFGPAFVDMLDGIFAFAIHDPKTGQFFIARDHIGIVPLYIGWGEHGATYIASELKAFPAGVTVQEFPPGHYYTTDGFTQWYKPAWQHGIPQQPATELKQRFEQAVERQLMADVPYGVLISGGLDSSLVAAIAAKKVPGLHSFCIGLEGSPDLAAAKKVAAHVGTIHHEITFTVQEGLDVLRDVIYHLETYDVTTIRAATPMYLMARQIKALGIKMVLSGEGADETFGGYLYFHMAPSIREFHEETVRKLGTLSKYDCLRANKAMAAWGVEARVPFLSKDFLDYAMSIDPKEKLCTTRIEKHVLREAFTGYLPEEILWRQKEQFSDGVGYSWIDSLKYAAEQHVTDKMLTAAAERFPIQPPMTKEEYCYREIFEQHFPSADAARTVPVGPTIACSSATAFRWSKTFRQSDPSGRAIASHTAAVQRV